jgi:hypothetical protein
VAFPLVVVGTNSLLIYLMGETLKGWTREKVIHIHFQRLIEWLLGAIANSTGLAAKLPDTMRAPGVVLYELFGPVIDSTAVFAVFWLVLYALYRKQVFFRV